MQNHPFFGLFRRLSPRYWKLRKIAKQVRSGIVPKGVEYDTIMEALRVTKPPAVLEAFGFLFCKVRDKHGNLKQDLGLVGVREITTEFVKHLADAMTDSSVAIDTFNKHAMGDGSTAETDTDTALVSEQDGRAVGSQTHGATSNVYRSVATITAGGAYTAIEHGIFDSTGSGSDVLLDRTKLSSPPTLATDDEVEWTYDATITAGG
jgi:hypothetical protein